MPAGEAWHAGVIEAAVAAVAGGPVVEEDGATMALVGPCISALCYDFGADDLDTVVVRYGVAVRARTRDGGPALDLPGRRVPALSACRCRSRSRSPVIAPVL